MIQINISAARSRDNIEAARHWVSEMEVAVNDTRQVNYTTSARKTNGQPRRGEHIIQVDGRI